MKQINNASDVIQIGITQKSNGTFLLSFKVANEDYASMLRGAFKETAKVGYIYSEGNDYFYLRVIADESNDYVEETLPVAYSGVDWMPLINHQKITELVIIYPVQTNRNAQYGESILLSTHD